jgi:hypothetical protein
MFALTGLFALYGWPAVAIVCGPLLLEFLIRRVLLGGARARLRRSPGAPLAQKNMTRATAGIFVLVLCAVLAVNGFPIVGWKATAAIAALAGLYLVVGVAGSHGARFDFMAAFWWGALALGCAGLLIFIGGFPL